MLSAASPNMHHVSRFTFHVPPAPRPSPLAPRPSQRGVALVVTLLLLSIITFMVVTFLVVSRSQKGSVVTETDQAIARLGADMALERAKAAIIAPMLAWTNEFNYGLLVSVNYINRDGFDQTLPVGPNVINPTNVNYDYTRAPAALTLAQRNQNIANLLYDPRPPVCITSNRFQTTPAEFRYYLDLNRNGRYDTNGLLPVISDDPSNPFYDLNGNPMPQYQPGNTLLNFFVGDPEWIGGLERPEFAHSADNRFINRYAYIAVPAGNTLDINAIHNYAKWQLARARTTLTAGDGFLRDQGVGTWEINLAAFLVDLNTNLWPLSVPNKFSFSTYTYDPDPGNPNRGTPFDDAVALMRYRYATNWNSLASVQQLFGPAGVSAFSSDYIDGYSAGPLMTGTWWPTGPTDNDTSRVGFPWSGGDNPNRFYTTQDLFDKSKTASYIQPGRLSFIDRLALGGAATNSYDRYTYYRLLSQLGTDSQPEPPGKMNLNYRNVDNNGNVVPNMATNFIPWTNAVLFFTNAANRLLANAGYGFTTANIQLWPTNQYTPSVHRLLQLAANLYDASANRTNTPYPYLPSVFRPLFLSANGGNQVYISGYIEETGTRFLAGNMPWRDLQLAGDRAALQPADMAYGVPVVIGAKKGYPNFNEFAMQTRVQVTRKLQLVRSRGLAVDQTNQMFIVAISNVFGVEAWNSYSTNFQRDLRMTVRPEVSVVVSNQAGTVLVANSYTPPTGFISMDIRADTWSGYDPGQEQYSFRIPVLTNVLFLTNSTFSRNPDRFIPLTGRFEAASPAFYVPHWWLNLRTRLRFALIDTSVNRIVDFVNLDSAEPPLNLTDTFMQGGVCGDEPNPFWTPDAEDPSMWCTNHYPSRADETLPTYGILNQLQASFGLSQPDWNHALNEFPLDLSKDGAIDFFRAQFDLTPLTYFNTTFQKTNVFNAPFQPTRNTYLFTTWQANDPLVHYTTGDLMDLLRTNRVEFTPVNSPVANLGWVNGRYSPWGGNPAAGSTSPTKTALEVKDPLVLRSDFWDFPTNKFPNVGWVGRVHRGTPWQTVYLKSPPVDLPTWQQWTGNGQIITNWDGKGSWAVDANFTLPANDRSIVDLFTTALNDNATRGQLSINQTNLASWSAVLGGVVVLTNSMLPRISPWAPS